MYIKKKKKRIDKIGVATAQYCDSASDTTGHSLLHDGGAHWARLQVGATSWNHICQQVSH